jgi:hypothetical protein
MCEASTWSSDLDTHERRMTSRDDHPESFDLLDSGMSGNGPHTEDRAPGLPHNLIGVRPVIGAILHLAILLEDRLNHSQAGSVGA